MSGHPDVMILGGGVIGLTTAYYLAREGVSVVVLDRGDIGREASWAGAGIIPPGVASRALTAYDKLRARSSEAFPGLVAELAEWTGIDCGYQICGGIEFFAPDTHIPTAAWDAEGVAYQRLTPADLRAIEPAIQPLADGWIYHFPEMAQIRNPWHLRALVAACERCGVKLSPNCPVEGFECVGDRVTAVRTSVGERCAGKFIVAAGAWTDELLRPLGVRLGIRPIRGQIVLLKTGQTTFRSVVLNGKEYLVPRGDGNVLVGATEEDVGFVKLTTADAVANLIRLAERLVPGLATAHVERCWAGLRPGSTDGLPTIGHLPEWTNVYVAAGHFRAGIQLSPATAMALTDLIVGREPAVSLEDFAPGRSPAPPFQAAFRS